MAESIFSKCFGVPAQPSQRDLGTAGNIEGVRAQIFTTLLDMVDDSKSSNYA
jgi:hypothetical protein